MLNTPTLCRWPGGVVLDYLNPTIEAIDFAWIAARLAGARRFNGNNFALAVAGHSCLVADAMEADGNPPRLVLAGLLHDAHEAFTGDISAPLRNAIKAMSGLDPITAISHSLDRVIFAAAGIGHLASNGAVELLVRGYDLRSRHNEVRDCLGAAPTDYPGCFERPALDGFNATSYAYADGGRAAFLDRYQRLAA